MHATFGRADMLLSGHVYLLWICFGFVSTYSQAMGVRFLLGLFEAGMLPGIAYYMSRWYRKAELAFRLALYVVTAPLVCLFQIVSLHREF